MNFTTLNNRASKLMKEGHKSKFYEMVLCYGLENLCENDTDKFINENQFDELLAVISDYLEDCYHVSVYDAVDGCINCIKEVGIDAFLKDCDSNGDMLANAVCSLY